MTSLQHSHPLRKYLELRRTRSFIAVFAVAAAIFVIFPGVDLRISEFFFDDGFPMANQGWARILHASVPWFIVVSTASVAGVYAFNKFTGRAVGRITGRKVVYLLLVLALGAGFVVNGTLKDGFGRARPRDIQEFGGSQHFTPAFVMSSACHTNCSFSSGDSSGAFFSLAFAIAFTKRRSVAAASVGYGVLVSAARITAGAHFLSDTVVSGFVMLLVSDALHYRMFLHEPDIVADSRAPEPAPVALFGAAGKPSASS